ncbi:heavy-metal-associated domain-containing protein [Deinococcus sp. YIM 77859]|uniref:CopZ family metallochaperone n=1 Tax=Deinococcus sp. YIM 77859 TaxID=1540221 RepID=UPI00054F8324|nr:heavy metal-associated domain-containing protein [Deinococcus sp. YIM 77859]
MTQTYKVTGMTCAHCASSVESALKRVPGVANASVKYIRKEATVEGQADSQALKQAVREAGYGLEDK